MLNKKLKILDYYNDYLLLEHIQKGENYTFSVTEPKNVEVVLGRSMIPEEDIKINNCITDNIPIYRRKGGGGTVVLSKGILIISIAGISKITFHFREQMNSVNKAIINALMYLGIRNISINGISDITIGNRKILGSSFYKSRNIVLYQGSLLYNPDFNIFSRYLKQPKKMHEYRKNRDHKDFLTSIIREGYNINLSELIYALKVYLKAGPPWRTMLQKQQDLLY